MATPSFFGTASTTKSNVVVSQPKVKKGEVVKTKQLATSSSRLSTNPSPSTSPVASVCTSTTRTTAIPASTSASASATQYEKKKGIVNGSGDGNGKGKGKGKGKEKEKEIDGERKAGGLKINPSDNSADPFGSLHRMRRDIDYVSDKLEYRRQLEEDRQDGPSRGASGSSGAQTKFKPGSSTGKTSSDGRPVNEDRTNKQGGTTRSSKLLSYKASKGPTESFKPNGRPNPAGSTSLNSQSDHTPVRTKPKLKSKLKSEHPSAQQQYNSGSGSEDEMALGTTPVHHMAESYRNERERHYSQEPHTPASTSTSGTHNQSSSHPDRDTDDSSPPVRKKKKKMVNDIGSSTIRIQSRIQSQSQRSGGRSSQPYDQPNEGVGRKRTRKKDGELVAASDEDQREETDRPTPRPKSKSSIEPKPLNIKGGGIVTKPSRADKVRSVMYGPKKTAVAPIKRQASMSFEDTPRASKTPALLRKRSKIPSYSDTGSDTNATSLSDISSEGVQEKKLRKKEKFKPKRPCLNGGHMFFEQLAQMSSDADDNLGLLEESGDVAKLLDLEMDGDEALSEEDRAYLAAFRSKTDLCPYCSEPLPTEPSALLRQAQNHLERISTPTPTATNPSARHLPWQQHIDFCSLHAAETGLIPLGLRDGYPDHIDFVHLERRLEVGWIRERLDEIILRPESSVVFKRIIDEVNEVGRIKWGALTYQSKEENLAAIQPGYYGDLGRAIMINHFLQLRRWGYFPSLNSRGSSSQITAEHNPPTLDPLSWHDFISHVLVPESANLLIMADRGADSDTNIEYAEAEKIREESVKYGTWRFREDGEEAEGIIDQLFKSRDEKRRRLKLLAINEGNKDVVEGKRDAVVVTDVEPGTWLGAEAVETRGDGEDLILSEKEGSITPKAKVKAKGRGTTKNARKSASPSKASIVIVDSSPSIESIAPNNTPTPAPQSRPKPTRKKSSGPAYTSRTMTRHKAAMGYTYAEEDEVPLEEKGDRSLPQLGGGMIEANDALTQAQALPDSQSSINSSQSTQYDDGWDEQVLEEAVALTDKVALTQH